MTIDVGERENIQWKPINLMATEMTVKLNEPMKENEKVVIHLKGLEFIKIKTKQEFIEYEIKSEPILEKDTLMLEAGKDVTKVALTIAAVVNFLVTGSLSQLWTVVNGMQFVSHIPLLAT